MRIDKKEVLRTDWMFKLVGQETFKLGKHSMTVYITATSGFDYEYTLEVDGQTFERFTETRSKLNSTWVFSLDGVDYRAVLEKDTVQLWLNGKMIEEEPEFAEDGTEIRFMINDHQLCLKSISTKHHRSGIEHIFTIDGNIIGKQS